MTLFCSNLWTELKFACERGESVTDNCKNTTMLELILVSFTYWQVIPTVIISSNAS